MIDMIKKLEKAMKKCSEYAICMIVASGKMLQKSR